MPAGMAWHHSDPQICALVTPMGSPVGCRLHGPQPLPRCWAAAAAEATGRLADLAGLQQSPGC